MSFSLNPLPVDPGVFAGTGPLHDIFEGLTADSILRYVATWLLFIVQTDIVQWLIIAACVVFAVAFIIKFIPAFSGGSPDEF